MSTTLTLARGLLRMFARYSLVSTLLGPWSIQSPSEETVILQHAFSSAPLFYEENLSLGLHLENS